MSITVRLPSSLKEWFDGRDETLCHGETVGKCLDDLAGMFPGLKDRFFDEKGEVNSAVLIFLNGDNIRDLEGATTPVQDGDEISIIPLAAGG